MKKYIFWAFVISLAASGLYFTFTDESYEYYKKAKALYEEGEYREAHELLEIGLQKNQLNRKIIALKGKLYPIVEGEQNLKEAKELYEEAVNLALQGRISAAKISMSRAYELAGKITSSSLVKDEADELIRKIERDATLVLESAPETQFKNAVKRESEGKLVRAYEILNNIDMKNEKVKRKMSDIAYRLGDRRYRELAGESAANEHLVADAVYWFSQVQAFDDKYISAEKKISELKLMKTE